MNYCEIKKFDIADGLGVRATLFVSGCRNHCKGCFQPETWDFEAGNLFSKEVKEDFLKIAGMPQIQGITLLGGDPFEEENQKEVYLLVKEFKEKYPNKDVWAYTGYILDKDLMESQRKYTEYTNKLLNLIDVLIDGPFIEEEKDMMLLYRGSRNQRLIDMNEYRKTGIISELKIDKPEDKAISK